MHMKIVFEISTELARSPAVRIEGWEPCVGSTKPRKILSDSMSMAW